MNAFLHLTCVKGLIAVVGFSILVGCSQTSTPPEDDVIGSYTTTAGSAVAARLQALYEDTRKDC
jgi:hypothetical protein